ncbi:hypothetical protein M0R04_07910 [Candidatus Dojkabacteria bacterium]|nr:hypothetical protein [Candidatus Dojkabacteria bacterium]
MKGQQEMLSQYDNLYKTYDQLLNNYIQQYAGSTDKYVVETYKAIKAQRDALLTNLVEAQRAIQNTFMQKALTPASALLETH